MINAHTVRLNGTKLVLFLISRLFLDDFFINGDRISSKDSFLTGKALIIIGKETAASRHLPLVMTIWKNLFVEHVIAAFIDRRDVRGLDVIEIPEVLDPFYHIVQ